MAISIPGSRAVVGGATQIFFATAFVVSPASRTELATRLTFWPNRSARFAASTTALLIFFASGFMPFILGMETPLGTEMPSTLGCLADRVAATAPATPASAAPEASNGTFALRASGATSPAPCLIDSEMRFELEVEAEVDFGLALPLAGDRLEPFDLELDDRDPPELEPDRRALDFVFVWATVAIPFFP